MDRQKYGHGINIFGSVRSSRSHNLRPFVCPVLVCLELLFFIFWHQILQDDFRSVSGLSSLCAYFVSSDRRSPKYFVLLPTLRTFPRNMYIFQNKFRPEFCSHSHLHLNALGRWFYPLLNAIGPSLYKGAFALLDHMLSCPPPKKNGKYIFFYLVNVVQEAFLCKALLLQSLPSYTVVHCHYWSRLSYG